MNEETTEDEGLPEIIVQPQMRARDRYPLRGTSIRYQDPMEPVAEQEWEVLTLDTEGTYPLSPPD